MLSVIKPSIPNRARAIEVVDRLQTHVRPEVFPQRAIYDGKANLFSAGPLALTTGGFGSVSPFSYYNRNDIHLYGSVKYTVGRYTIEITLAAGQVINSSYVICFLTMMQIK